MRPPLPLVLEVDLELKEDLARPEFAFVLKAWLVVFGLAAVDFEFDTALALALASASC